MKLIKYTTRFMHHFRERIEQNERLKEEFLTSVDAFLTDRASVNDHQLRGKMSLQRAFCMNDDYRVVYSELKEYFLFDDVGTHDEIYLRRKRTSRVTGKELL